MELICALVGPKEQPASQPVSEPEVTPLWSPNREKKAHRRPTTTATTAMPMSKFWPGKLASPQSGHFRATKSATLATARHVYVLRSFKLACLFLSVCVCLSACLSVVSQQRQQQSSNVGHDQLDDDDAKSSHANRDPCKSTHLQLCTINNKLAKQIATRPIRGRPHPKRGDRILARTKQLIGCSIELGAAD